MINPYLRYSLQIFYFLVPFIPLYLFSKRIGKSTGRQRVEPMILMLGFYGVIIDELLTITLDPVYSSESVPYLFLETIALIPILEGAVCIYYFVITIDLALSPKASFNSEKIVLTIVAAISILYPAAITVDEGILWFIYVFLWYVPLFLIALSYARVSFIFRRMRIDYWYLAYIGAVIILLSILFCSIFPKPRLGWLEELMYLGDIPAFFGGLLTFVPSLELLRKMREPLPEQEGSGSQILSDIARKGSEVIGGTCYAVIRGAVEGYNMRFGKNVRLRGDLSVEGLAEEDQGPFLEHVFEVFYQCIGPLTFDVLNRMDGMDRYADILRRRHGG